jgi:stalled ribosome rescue protein Dom34
LFIDPAKQHDDLRLLRRAIKKRWEIPAEFRDVVVGRLRDLIEEGDPEIALKAIAEVRHLESQNQRDEHKVVDVSIAAGNFELDAIASDLGIEVGVVEDATRKAEIGTSQP